MKDKVKKIIIAIDNNQLTKVIVVYNNSLVRYDNTKYNSNDLMNIYSNNVRKLKEIYKDEIKGLSNQEEIDKLASLGKIQNLKKNLIMNIEIINENTELEKIIIKFEDREEEIKKSDYASLLDYEKIKKDKILELCNDYSLEYDELSKFGLLIKDKKIDEVLKENKIKNFVIRNKRLLSSILIGAITVTGIGIGMVKLSKNTKTNDKEEFVYEDNVQEYLNTPYSTTIEPIDITSLTTPYNDTTTIEPTATMSLISEENDMPIHPKVTPPPLKSLNKIIFTCKYDLNSEEPLNDSVLAKKVSGNYVYLKKDNLTKVINDLNQIRLLNMQDLESDKDNLVIIYYENFIDSNLKDKAFVKYFSNIGNKIIEYAFKDNKEEVINYANFSSLEYERLITNNEPLEVIIDGKQERIYYSDLSIDAKEVISNITWNNIQCLNVKKDEHDLSSNLVLVNYYGVEFYVFDDKENYKTIGFKGVQPHNACLRYSRAWAADYMSGTTNFDASGLTYYGVATENKQLALKVIKDEVMKGCPVIIRVNAKQAFFNGKVKTTPRHFVTVCGIRKNADFNNLKESDFLIYDPTYKKRFKILGSHAAGGTNDRKLLKTEQNPGRRGPNYSDGYYLEIYNDSADYLEIEDVYEGKI